MIRIIKLSGRYYGCELPVNRMEMVAEIKEYVESGNPVIIVDSVEDLTLLDIEDDVTMVEREDEE